MIRACGRARRCAGTTCSSPRARRRGPCWPARGRRPRRRQRRPLAQISQPTSRQRSPSRSRRKRGQRKRSQRSSSSSQRQSPNRRRRRHPNPSRRSPRRQPSPSPQPAHSRARRQAPAQPTQKPRNSPCSCATEPPKRPIAASLRSVVAREGTLHPILRARRRHEKSAMRSGGVSKVATWTSGPRGCQTAGEVGPNRTTVPGAAEAGEVAHA